MHSGKTDPVQMGRSAGLKVPETQLRRELKQDDAIRAEAKDVIRRGLAGDESVSKTMLDAARSVFSFRAAQPPQVHEQPERERLLTAKGRRVVGLPVVHRDGRALRLEPRPRNRCRHFLDPAPLLKRWDRYS